MPDNTLLLKLAGPMQSWGTQSKLQLRRTDLFPSKSGVLGLLLACKGVGRQRSHEYLPALNAQAMGIRIDDEGTVQADYHTAGAKIGIRRPKNGKPKEFPKMRPGWLKFGEDPKYWEPQLSRRQYLYGASFLVALRGDPSVVADCADAVRNPKWPPFLGRKCCVPSEPIFAGTGDFPDLESALRSLPWKLREDDPEDDGDPVCADRDCWIEDPAAEGKDSVRDVYDTARRFGRWDYHARRVRKTTVNVEVEYLPRPERTPWKDPYGPEWDEQRKARLEHDGHQCVFCHSPATQVHHTDYEDVRRETLRSLCEFCHDACTMLEYARGDHPMRVDPADPDQREMMLEQLDVILTQGRRTQRRRELLRRKGTRR